VQKSHNTCLNADRFEESNNGNASEKRVHSPALQICRTSENRRSPWTNPTPQLFLAKAVAVRWPQITAGFVPIVLRVWSEV